MKKTRKECREETGYEPEDISKLARSHPAMARLPKIGKNVMTEEQKVEWVYEAMKSVHQKGRRLASQTTFEIKKASDLVHNCTGSTSCLGCERDRRDAYADGGNYY
tara:strand:- start:5 stop:322 length:318 start_codon:yes stop_codon:yes gene_type:complete